MKNVDTVRRHCVIVTPETSIRHTAELRGSSNVGSVVSVDDLLMNVVADLDALVRPITGEVLFGHHDAPVPMVSPAEPRSRQPSRRGGST